MENFIWGPYGAHMDVPRWVPDESLLQNPHRSHMGCPYRTHIINHQGPIWVPHSLLAGQLIFCMYTTLGQGQEITLTFNTHINSKLLHKFN